MSKVPNTVNPIVYCKLCLKGILDGVCLRISIEFFPIQWIKFHKIDDRSTNTCWAKADTIWILCWVNITSFALILTTTVYCTVNRKTFFVNSVRRCRLHWLFRKMSIICCLSAFMSKEYANLRTDRPAVHKYRTNNHILKNGVRQTKAFIQ
mgnify:CR=1 FL=1